MIAIIDYGCGNIGSVIRMILRSGGHSIVVKKPNELENATKIIIPGVGSFDEGMKLLKEKGFVEALRNIGKENKIPILGICLGMQLLFEKSEEGKLEGLGLIKGRVVKFDNKGQLKIKIPHMGWNELNILQKSPLIDMDEQKDRLRFYFVHSYYVVCEDHNNVVATVNYGGEVAAVVRNIMVHGVQFHPEKSHRFGMELIKRFVEL